MSSRVKRGVKVEEVKILKTGIKLSFQSKPMDRKRVKMMKEKKVKGRKMEEKGRVR